MPDFRDYVRRRLPPLGLSGAREGEVVEELALELEERYQRALRGGLDEEQAWAEVRGAAGDWREVTDELRSALAEPQVQTPEPDQEETMFARLTGEWRRDLAYAARQLRKGPGFTTVAVVMLALGVGANTAIFSLLNAILLRSLPVHEAAQLVFLGEPKAEGDTSFLPEGPTAVFSYPFFRAFQRDNQGFSDVAAIQSFLVFAWGRVAGNTAMEKVSLELVSGSYFRTLGVNPMAGRAFTDADDDGPGAHPIAVARYGWWRERFPTDPSFSGKNLTIGSTVYTIVGIAPPAFSGLTVGRQPDLWIPLSMQAEVWPDRNGLEKNMFRCLHMIGRLRPGVGRAQAQANTNLVFRQILRGFVGPKPTENQLANIQHARIDLKPAATGRSRLRQEYSAPLAVLMVVVVLVLLIASANVANLLLARASARQREMAVRMSLGAQRGRVMRQLLSESVLLGTLGAAFGVAFAFAASRLLLAMVSGSEALPIQVTPDARVLAFTIAVTAITVLLFGAAPALRATGLDLSTSLKTRAVVSGSGRNRLARGLVVGQVAVSLLLLAGAGLFLRSLRNLIHVDVGFDRQNVVRMYIDPRAAGYHPDARLVATTERIVNAVSALPGVRSAAFAQDVFDGGGSSTTDVRVPGLPDSAPHPRTDLNVVDPHYLDVMKLPILFGRGLAAPDTATSRKVAVINQTMVRTHFGGAWPIGRTFSVGDDREAQDVEVVGVMQDAKYMELEEEQMPAAIFPYAQHPQHFIFSFVVRSDGDPESLIPAIRKTIAGVDPHLPVSDIRTLAQMVDDFTVNRRVVAQLSTFFGILAALLASIGMYGVMSYGIARRTNEFGIRMALGAKRRDVVWVVLRETLILAGAGIAIGLVLAYEAARLIEKLLFGVHAGNLLPFALAILAMVAVALLAGWLPARRATRIDPSVALRWE